MSQPEPMREIGPTPRRDAAWYAQHAPSRLSFTRFAIWKRCPAWYRHQYLEWHRVWSTPVLRAGHAVQGVVEKVFDARPDADVTIETLEARASERGRRLLAEALERERRAHDADPNGLGPWDLPRERYEGYVAQAVRFHLLEVRARLANIHPRTGQPLPLPAIAGVAEAWKAVKPWHPPSRGAGGPVLEAIPAGWFQGQYDLVYSWTGGRRIVDLKSSGGRSLFGTEIEQQLRCYAWMEREAGRGPPEGIEGWFLGLDAPMVIPSPDDAALDAFTAEAGRLIDLSRTEEEGFGLWRPEDFEPAPATVPGFAPEAGEPSAWCGVCPAAFNCPKSRRTAPPAGQGWRFDGRPPAGGTLLAIEVLVLGVGEPQEKKGKVKRRVTVANESGVRSYSWDEQDVVRLAGLGLRVGRAVRLTNLNPWRPPSGGPVMLYPGRGTGVEVLADPWTGVIPAAEGSPD